VRFEADYARALDRLIEQRDATGQGEPAIAAAEKLTAIDPLRDDWQRRLLRMLARHRSSTAALSHARTFTALLRKELDVEPETATIALIEQIQRGEVEPASREQTAPSLPEAIEAIEPAAKPVPVFSAPILLPDHAAPSVPETRAVLAPPQTKTPRFRLHPAVSTSLIVFSTFALTVSLMFLAEASLMPRLIPMWANQTARANMAAALPEKSPIVVLPFESATGTESASVAEQVSNDVIDSLSHVPNLKVISRLTSHELGQPANEKDKDIAAIGARLGVRYALHGSVQTEADKLHVNVELIDIASRLQVWSHRFDQDQPDRAAASDTIARQLGRALQVEVISFQAEHPSTSAPPAKAEIDQFVGKGWAVLMNRPNADGLAKAEAQFREALQRDPERLGAMLGLAAHHTWASSLAPPELRESMRAEAVSLLTRVIARRPEWSPPYYYQGVLLDMEGDPQAGLESIQKSVALNPSFAPGYAQIGRVLTRLGKADEALENIHHAMTLSPGDPAFPAWLVFAGLAEIERGHDAEALDLISRGAALEPDNPNFQASLAAAYALSGDWRNAEIHAARYRELTPTLTNDQRVAAFAGRWQPKRFATGARLALANVQ
jgi:TolB-like protein/Tfp pilus assembly protein PilF